jgi:CheY-like chemotaxis protein
MIPPSAVPVLMVDDNASKRFALKAVLAPLGYTIVEADSDHLHHRAQPRRGRTR